MKTKTILKTLAVALLMPAMLLTTACSSDDNIIDSEKSANTKGYALPVTVNVSRQGDEGTRASYNESTRKLSFSEGDKLFVEANYSSAGQFAGLLDYDAVSGQFSGTIYTQSQYTGTAEALLAGASALSATLVPAGYDTNGYLSISNAGAYNADLSVARNKVFALTKKEAVEQLNFESVDEYDNGFALAPQNAVVCFSISGLTANTEVEVIFKEKSDDSVPPVNVTTDNSGVATFAVGMENENFDDFSLTVDGNNIALPENKVVEAGHIYNISRSAAAATTIDLSTVMENTTIEDGYTITGTLGANVKISIADGATVTLDGVTITNLGKDCDWAGINCPGNATLVLKGVNTVCAGRDGNDYNNYPGIWIAPEKTLTIQGDGTLTAYSNANYPAGAGIGGGYTTACGNIVIEGGTINATGGDRAAGIGSGRGASCGTITINGGNVTATGGEYAAGIGSAYNGECGNITISGGTVVATGGEYGAGIGSSQNDKCGTITISGGTVTAMGGDFASGIGSGMGGECGNITITSGVTSVTATKGDYANSIGEGSGGTCGTVNIEDESKVTQN